MFVLWRLGGSGTSPEGRVSPRYGCFEGSYEQEMDSQSSVSPSFSPRVLRPSDRCGNHYGCLSSSLRRHLQDDIKMTWEPNVVAAQVEPYVTDYGIDTVSSAGGTPLSFPCGFHSPRTYNPNEPNR